MADLQTLLAKAEQVETLSGAIYRRLAAGFPEGARAWRIYQQLAQEEDEHAKRIRILEANLRSRPVPQQLTVDLPAVEQLVADAAALLRMLDELGPHLSVEESRRFMVAMERRFGAVHAHALVAGDPELEAFFGELAFQDQTHLELLERLDGNG